MECSVIAVSVSEAAKLSGLGRTTLYDLIREGRLPVCKIGKRTLIRVEALEATLRGMEAPKGRAH